MFRLRSGVLLLLVSLAITAMGQEFSGEWLSKTGGTETKMSLKQEGTKLSGTMNADGIDLNVSGTIDGKSAKGDLKVTTFAVTLKFKATLDGDALKLTIAETDAFEEAETLDFNRVGKASMGGTSKSSVMSSIFKKEPTAALKSGKEYQHASGGKFRYPADWQLSEQEAGLLLTPPDAASNEVVFIVGEPAEGATDPSSPELLAHFDSQVAELMPTLKRVGPVEKTAAGGGKAVILTWEGKHNGADFRVRAFITIMKGYGVALVGVGPKEAVEKRDKQLREIFQTFGWGEGKVDTTLVGTWNHWSYSGSGNYGREERAQIVLNADGTFSYNGGAETTITAQGTNSQGEQTWVGGANSRTGSGWKGRWTADGKTLILNFEDGTCEIFSYGFKQEGQNSFLVATPDKGGKATEWSRG